jgi:ADP-ribose pyrophosphatase
MTARINDRKVLHRARVFNVVRENITLGNGATVDFEFVQHPGAAAIVPILNDSQIVLINQYRHAVRETIWEIPAGTLDAGESALACAQRELVEETGYRAAAWESLAEITPVPGYSDERIHLFLARDLSPAQQDLDPDEVLQVHAVEFQAAMQMILRGEIRDGKTICGLLLARQRIENAERRGHSVDRTE